MLEYFSKSARFYIARYCSHRPAPVWKVTLVISVACFWIGIRETSCKVSVMTLVLSWPSSFGILMVAGSTISSGVRSIRGRGKHFMPATRCRVTNRSRLKILNTLLTFCYYRNCAYRNSTEIIRLISQNLDTAHTSDRTYT